MTRILSIRQPWAWFIIHAGKDVENRTWWDSFKGHLLIHAAKKMTPEEFTEACRFAREQCGIVNLPRAEDLKFGGIIGSVICEGWVKRSHSPWFTGPFAAKLSHPYPLPFFSMPGQLGLFTAPLQ